MSEAIGNRRDYCRGYNFNWDYHLQEQGKRLLAANVVKVLVLIEKSLQKYKEGIFSGSGYS